MTVARAVLAAGVVGLVVSAAGGIGDALGAVRRMRPGFVALAAVLATLPFALFATQLRWLIRRSGPITVSTAFGLALVVFGFGAITPAAPAEGLTIANRELQRRGRSRRTARLTVGLSEWFAQRTFYALAALDLVAVVALGHLALREAWPFVAVALVVVVALVTTAVMARRPSTIDRLSRVATVVRLRRPGRDDVPDDGHQRLHAELMSIVGPPRNRMRLAAVSAGAVLADAGILWAACHAAGFHMHPELVLLARTAGTIASWVPLLPGGLGVVEAAIPAVLHRFGAPLDAALAATLAYRALGTLVPAVAGAAALFALRSSPASRTEGNTHEHQ